MRTKAELKLTREYWVETLENQLYRAGVKRWESHAESILIFFNVEDLDDVHMVEAFINALKKTRNVTGANKDVEGKCCHPYEYVADRVEDPHCLLCGKNV